MYYSMYPNDSRLLFFNEMPCKFVSLLSIVFEVPKQKTNIRALWINADSSFHTTGCKVGSREPSCSGKSADIRK